MKNIFTYLLTGALIALLAGCSGYGFKSNDSTDPISVNKEGFLVIKYVTYAEEEQKLTGTLDQIGIRNNSDSTIFIDSIGLKKTFQSESVNTAQEYSVYEDWDPFSGKITERRSIQPGEWLFFVFPTKKINEFKIGDSLILDYHINIRSNDRTYTNKARIEKTIEKYDLPWI
jgi:hypothetical protein